MAVTQGQNSQLDLSQFTQALNKIHPMLQTVLLKIQDAVNKMGQNVGASATGYVAQPGPIQGIQVKNSGEMYHVTHTDFDELSKGTHYFTEIGVNDPAFSAPLIKHHGVSRSPEPFTLPTKDDSGNPINYYFRGYKQLPGSLPGVPVNFGGQTPTAVAGTGSTHMTPLSSTGSGTSSGSGQQAGAGFGRVLLRPQGV